MRAAATLLSVCSALAFTAPAAGAADRCAGPDTPLFGVARIDGDRFLARLDRRTLRPRAGSLVPLPRGLTGWNFGFSPGCDAVALPDHTGGEILLVDLERGRRTGTLRVGRRAPVGAVAWSRPDRLTTFAGRYPALRLVTLSVPDGRVVASERVGGRPEATTQATTLGMVVLAAPRKRIGPTTLVLATPDGDFLRAPLTRIRGGFAFDTRRRSLGRRLSPGLAVDEATGRAYVVAANRPLVAEVDLLNGAVSYHELRAGSARAAKGLSHAAMRQARWLGDGMIAVSGEELRSRRIDPYGLQLIDTADWTVDTLHRSLRWFLQTGEVLVGANAGLAAFGFDGRRRFDRFQGNERVGLWGAAWPYAYLTVRLPHERTYVIDLRSGRTTTVLPTVRLPVIFGAR